MLTHHICVLDERGYWDIPICCKVKRRIYSYFLDYWLYYTLSKFMQVTINKMISVEFLCVHVQLVQELVHAELVQPICTTELKGVC